MRQSLSLKWHLLLLLGFCVFMVCLWMLPVMAVGFPYELPDTLPGRRLLQTGILQIDSSRLMQVVLAGTHLFIAWENIAGWLVFNCVLLALAVFPYWWCVHRLFNAPIAWIATVVFSLMPLYWLKALRVDGYALALCFLFLSCAVFLELYPGALPSRRQVGHTKIQIQHRKLLALACSGLLFGAALAARDAFITFMPWLLLAYVWLQRTKWRQACLGAVLFGCCVGVVYSFPFFVNALQPDLSPTQRVSEILSVFETREAGYGHFYRDDYTYQFAKEKFEDSSTQEFASLSWLERLQQKNYRLVFGVDDRTVFARLTNGFWLLLNQIPPLFLQDTVGGVFLWLFILPGIAVLYRDHKNLLCLLIGLIISMELVIRFGFHFRRMHLMNVGWVLSLLAAVGVLFSAQALSAHWQKVSVTALAAFMTVVIAGQLLQANRKQFARLYTRSTVHLSYAAADVIAALPLDAVVAYPIAADAYFYFQERERVYFHQDTVDELLREGTLAQAFAHYDISHVVGYSQEMVQDIKTVAPHIAVVPPVPLTGPSINISPWLTYILHIVR